MALTTYRNVGKFPVELLSDSPNERMRYYSNCVISHKNLEDSVATTMRYINSCEPESIIFVCGPSGVGKKEFIRELSRRIDESEKRNPDKSSDDMPVVSIEARAPEEGSFKFNSLWGDILIKMNTPMLGHSNIINRGVEGEYNGQKVIKAKTIKADYQTLLHEALAQRHVKALIINEAQHMCRVATEIKANWSLDVIKALVNDGNTVSETVLVLVGTYDLLNLIDNASAAFADQIHQRGHIVDFARYHGYDEDEMLHFGKTAKKLLYCMPFEKIDEKLVENNWRYLFKYSLGRIGALKRWFIRAYAYALEQGANYLTKEHLESTKVPGNRVKVELTAIEKGESSMARIQSDGDIDDLFKFYDKPEKEESKKAPAAKKNTKPFEPKPRRIEAYGGLVNTVSQGSEKKLMMYPPLYNIEPIEVGTPYVEGIAGYIKRLAEAHCVTPLTLLKSEVYPHIPEHDCYRTSFINYDKRGWPASVDFLDKVVRILEAKTTNENIRNTTVTKYGFSIHMVCQYRKFAAWCPICFEEAKQSRRPVYEPLIWCFEDINICGKHQVNLVDICPYCGKQIKRFFSTAIVGYCYHCKSWLGTNDFNDTSMVEKQNILVYNKICHRLSDIPNIIEPPDIDIISAIDFFSAE